MAQPASNRICRAEMPAAQASQRGTRAFAQAGAGQTDWLHRAASHFLYGS